MRRVQIVTMVLLAVVAHGLPCDAREPYENQWGPFTGTAVDASTGQPIPGAVFTVFWIREIPFIGHAAEQFFDARVAVTNEQGHFNIPRRSAPFFFPGSIKPPHLSCVAPGYAPFHDFGAQNALIAVRLRPLTAEERRLRGSRDDTLGTIPPERGREFQRTIDLERARMHLPPMSFYTAHIGRASQ